MFETHINERLLFPCNGQDTYKGDTFEDARMIYERIVDGKSRSIFVNRLLYSMTNDFKYTNKIVESSAGAVFFDKIKFLHNARIFIYGAGIRGERLLYEHPNINWIGFIDENRKGLCRNLPVYTVNEYFCINESNDFICISNMACTNEIKEKLIKHGIVNNHIIALEDYNDLSAKSQYFDKTIVNDFRKSKVFVDIGGYDGRDTISFMNWTEGEHARAYVFEPDIENYKLCIDNLSEYKNVTVLNKGCGEKKEKRTMYSKGMSSFFVENNEGCTDNAFITSIDEELPKEIIDFIKIDIEGFEMHALKGLVKTIKKSKPIVAISIYHKRYDILAIPKFLLEINNNYRFKLAHYSCSIYDTVLYAIPIKD